MKISKNILLAAAFIMNAFQISFATAQQVRPVGPNANRVYMTTTNAEGGKRFTGASLSIQEGKCVINDQAAMTFATRGQALRPHVFSDQTKAALKTQFAEYLARMAEDDLHPAVTSDMVKNHENLATGFVFAELDFTQKKFADYLIGLCPKK